MDSDLEELTLILTTCCKTSQWMWRAAEVNRTMSSQKKAGTQFWDSQSSSFLGCTLRSWIHNPWISEIGWDTRRHLADSNTHWKSVWICAENTDTALTSLYTDGPSHSTFMSHRMACQNFCKARVQVRQAVPPSHAHKNVQVLWAPPGHSDTSFEGDGSDEQFETMVSLA